MQFRSSSVFAGFAAAALLLTACGVRAPARQATERLSGLAMTSQSAGSAWGFRTGGRLVIYKTVDGGTTWHTHVVPHVRRQPSNPDDAALAFRGTGRVWVAWITPPNGGRSSLQVVRTADGGRTWSVATASLPAVLAGGTVAEMGFTSRLDGWLAALSAGQGGWQAKVVLMTQDGGATWRQVSADTGRVANPQPTSDALPEEGGVRMEFLDRLIGWAGLDHFMTPGASVNLFRTSDGGAHWTLVVAPVPARFLTDGSAADVPTLRGKRGLLLVTFMRRGGAAPFVEVYDTSDGGTLWHALSSLPGWLVTQTFHGAETGLAALSSGLWRTQDGGRTWEELPLPAKGSVVSLRLVTGRVAWLLLDAEGGSRIYRTDDAGTTWRMQPFSLH